MLDLSTLMNPKTYGMDTATFAIVAASLGAVGMALRKQLEKLVLFAVSKLYVTLAFSSESTVMLGFSRWMQLNEKHMLFSPRSLTLYRTGWNGSAKPVAGYGTTWYKVPGLPLMSITRTKMTERPHKFNQEVVDSPCEFSIKFYLTGAAPVAQFVTTISEITQAESRQQMDYRSSAGGAFWIGRDTVPRDIDTVTLPADQLQRIVQSVETFFKRETRDFYERCGIPYRRGILLHGQPGTGKSTLARVLRTQLRVPLYSLMLGSVTDTSLVELFQEVNGPAIVLIEDFDAAGKATHARRPARVVPRLASSATPAPMAKSGASWPNGLGMVERPLATPELDADNGDHDSRNEKETGLTLAGILNALDGVQSPSNVLFIYTTNHIEQLDPALLRDGRCDLIEEIRPLTPDLIHQLLARILDAGHATMPDWMHGLPVMAASQVQGMALRAWLDNPATAYAQTLQQLRLLAADRELLQAA